MGRNGQGKLKLSGNGNECKPLPAGDADDGSNTGAASALPGPPAPAKQRAGTSSQYRGVCWHKARGQGRTLVHSSPQLEPFQSLTD